MLEKSKLNSAEIIICKTLIDSNISHDEFVLTIMCWNNFMIWKKKPKILMASKSKLYTKQYCFIYWSVEKIQKLKTQK